MYQNEFYDLGIQQLTCPGKVVEEADANDEGGDKEQELTMIIGAD